MMQGKQKYNNMKIKYKNCTWKNGIITWYEYLLLIPLSDISISSYFAAVKPGCILLIFGFTPILEPPEKRNKHVVWKWAFVFLILQSYTYFVDNTNLSKKNATPGKGKERRKKSEKKTAAIREGTNEMFILYIKTK